MNQNPPTEELYKIISKQKKIINRLLIISKNSVPELEIERALNLDEHYADNINFKPTVRKESK